MLRDLGWLKQIFVKNASGTVINPATNEKLEELKTLLSDIENAVDGLELTADTINLNTDTLEAKVQSVRDQLNVLLSTRASESTSQEILNALGETSGTNLLAELQNIVSRLNDTDFATEDTLIEVRNYLDTVETKLQSLIDKNQAQETGGNLADIKTNLDTLNNVDFSTESTVAEIRDTLGQESGTTVLNKLQNIWDKLVSLFNNGLAKIKIWDGTYTAEITETGRIKVDTLPPVPLATTPVKQIEYSNVSTTHDNIYIIPNGETLTITRFNAGAEVDSVSGNVIELLADPNGDGSVLTVIDIIFASGTSDQHELHEHYVGDGTYSIRLRRKRLGGGSKWIHGSWEGYY